MNSVQFQLNKFCRLIRLNGKEITFVKEEENNYGEPNGETKSQTVIGVYHETTSFLSKTSTEAATVRKKASPMLLVLYRDIKDLTHQYKVLYNGNTYKIGEIKNIGEANVVCDISLEEVQKDV